MAWWKFGRESKNEKKLRELHELLTADKQPGEEGQVEDATVVDPSIENIRSPLDDDGTPFFQLRGTWDTEQDAFRIEMDWNAPGLKHIIAMGVEGETDFEVAAYGVTLMAHQVLETEQERRANKENQILAMREDDAL